MHPGVGANKAWKAAFNEHYLAVTQGNDSNQVAATQQSGEAIVEVYLAVAFFFLPFFLSWPNTGKNSTEIATNAICTKFKRKN